MNKKSKMLKALAAAQGTQPVVVGPTVGKPPGSTIKAKKVPENPFLAAYGGASMMSFAAQAAIMLESLAPGTEARAEVPKDDFAYKGGYPIPDRKHARAALWLAARHHGKDSAAFREIQAKVHAKFPPQ